MTATKVRYYKKIEADTIGLHDLPRGVRYADLPETLQLQAYFGPLGAIYRVVHPNLSNGRTIDTALRALLQDAPEDILKHYREISEAAFYAEQV